MKHELELNDERTTKPHRAKTGKPQKCCNNNPCVFDMSNGEWVVHCPICWEGTLPMPTRAKAVAEWNAIFN